ncbi:MAG: 23S rRNA (uracil(1939)-C(5))-methyltransferase RlmD [Planctomycetota bacterium]
MSRDAARPSHIPVRAGENLELAIERMADGPDGFARKGGYALLVEGGLPGERVLAKVTSAARRFGRARVVEVLSPSPDRVEPPCRHFADCGGCQWQHASLPAQRAWKRERLRSALAHALGDAAIEVGPCLFPAAGRRHKIALHLRNRGRELQPCLHRRRSLDLVEILECPACDEEGLSLAFAAVDELSRLGEPAFDPERGGVLRSVLVRRSASTGESHVVVVATRRPRGIERAAERIQAAGASSVSWNQNDGPPGRLLGRRTFPLAGPRRIVERVAGIDLRISASSFFQTSPAAASMLVDRVIAGLQPTAADSAIDLFCGAGLFTLPLARSCEIALGVEQDEGAISDARESAAANGVANAEFVRGSALARLRRPLPRVSLAVLDPPRAGCGEEVARSLARLRVRRVAYVSCEPASLARDLASFAAQGLVPVSVTPVDMFPHTSHVEAVAILERSRVARGPLAG